MSILANCRLPKPTRDLGGGGGGSTTGPHATHLPTICQNLGGGVGGRVGGVLAVWPGGGSQGGGGFLNTMQFPRLSNFSRSSVAMVCHWVVQREQNKDQTHSTPFNLPWPLHHYLSKLTAAAAPHPTAPPTPQYPPGHTPHLASFPMPWPKSPAPAPWAPPATPAQTPQPAPWAHQPQVPVATAPWQAACAALSPPPPPRHHGLPRLPPAHHPGLRSQPKDHDNLGGPGRPAGPPGVHQVRPAAQPPARVRVQGASGQQLVGGGGGVVGIQNRGVAPPPPRGGWYFQLTVLGCFYISPMGPARTSPERRRMLLHQWP